MENLKKMGDVGRLALSANMENNANIINIILYSIFNKMQLQDPALTNN